METAALTRGSIPPQLVSLALPLIFGNILQQLYNTIDAMVIGRFAGETAFAAIGVAGTVMNLFLFLLSGCCTGSPSSLPSSMAPGSGRLPAGGVSGLLSSAACSPWC